MSNRPLRIPTGAVRVPVPDTRQYTDTTCGASCLLSVAVYYRRIPKVSEAGEQKVVEASGMDPDQGSDPEHLIRAATALELSYSSKEEMSVGRLRYHLDQGVPVVVMLQAYGDPKRYRDDWEHGHWVVAIGYDEKRVYFEDPWIEGSRGYLSYGELAERWHDVGERRRHVPEYGLALWRTGGQRTSVLIRQAKRIP